MIEARPSWRVLFRQLIAWALLLALASAGKSIPASIAIMAITTRSSIKVKPRRNEFTCISGKADRHYLRSIRLKVQITKLCVNGHRDRLESLTGKRKPIE